MNHDDICAMDATELAERIRERELSPVEVMDAHQARIEALNPALNALVTLSPTARDEAQRAELAVMRNEPLGGLHGVPFTAKDSFDTRGLRATRGSKLFQDHIPEQDATAVARFRDAGGILLGKTNVPEFVLWAETDNLVFGPAVNPWDQDRTPGGSSGGEAAAIAAGLSPLGLGSDLSGSIRLPAHYCGIAGFKPTHGRIPLTGHWPDTLARFAHVGALARSVRDTRLALRLLEGSDGQDRYAQDHHLAASTARPSLGDLRVGWIAGDSFGPLDHQIAVAVASAAEALRPLVKSMEQTSLKSLDDCDYDLLTMDLYGAGGADYFSAVIEGREDLLHSVLRERLARKAPTLAEYVAAEIAVDRLRRDMTAYFHQFDILLCPVVPIPAPVRGQEHLVIEGKQVRPRSVLRATIPFDLTGVPAVSVPFAMSGDSLPIGVQVVGRSFDDDTVLDVAQQLAGLGNCVVTPALSLGR